MRVIREKNKTGREGGYFIRYRLPLSSGGARGASYIKGGWVIL